LKELTRTNQKINEKTIADFIETLNVDEKVKAELRAIKPNTYTGIYK
jgi:adenylosuccinate lyase